MANLLMRTHSRLRFIVAARGLTSLGSGITPIALAFGLLERPGGTATDLSIVFGSQAFAALLVMPFAGVVSEKVGRFRLIVASELGMGIATALMAALFWIERASMPAITILAVVVGGLAAFWWPAYASIVPSVSQHTSLHRANGLLAAATTAGLLLGNLLAGLLVTHGGIALALAIDAATFLTAALIIAWSCMLTSPRETTSLRGHRDTPSRVSAQVLLGWKQFTRRRWIVTSSLAFGVVVMTWRATKEVLGPAQAVLTPEGAAEWSAILAAQSLGLLIGSLLAARIHNSKLITAFVGLSGTAAWIASLATGSPFALLIGLAVLAGASITYFEVSWYSRTQAHVPDRALTHISSMQAASVLALGPLGLAIAGPLAASAGTQQAMGLMALLAVLAILFGILTNRRSTTRL